ncbi:MAG: DoxX family protein [Nitrosomonadales bacterium]|nr:DoxX family protein [Nitrosomonadales bacterium]
MNPLTTTLNLYYRSSRLLLLAAPALDLGLRLFLANVFFKSGLTKIQTWDSTLYLFREEYKVPLLPPDFAAYLGTGAELALPVLLVFGLLGRFAALGLTILNAVAAYSYYDQLSEAGLNQHLYWGLLLAVLLLHGLGKWSADEWLEKRLHRG